MGLLTLTSSSEHQAKNGFLDFYSGSQPIQNYTLHRSIGLLSDGLTSGVLYVPMSDVHDGMESDV